MSSVDAYLRLLKLPANATDDQIRSAINNELRLWNHRTNAATMEARQEAERKIQVLETAERMLLGAEGLAYRSQACGDSAGAEPEVTFSPSAIASAVEKLATARGTKAQERRGTVLCRRATLFYKGLDCIFEELVHKSYESDKDRKKFTARHGGTVVFEYIEYPGSVAPGQTIVFLEGPWVAGLMSFAATCGGT